MCLEFDTSDLTNEEFFDVYYSLDDLQNTYCPPTCVECSKDFGNEDVDIKDLGIHFQIIQLCECDEGDSDNQCCF